MEKKKIIAIDVDDTVSVTSSIWEIVFKQFFNNHFPYLNIIDGKVYNGEKLLTNDSYEMIYFENSNIKLNEDTWKLYPAIDDARKNIKYLKSLGYKICFITARTDKKYGNAEAYTKRWLDYVDIPYDRVFANCQSKGKKCKEINAFVMIDDDPKFLEYALTEGVPAIQILNKEAPKSRKRISENPQIKICENWAEVTKNIIIIDNKQNHLKSGDSEHGF